MTRLFRGTVLGLILLCSVVIGESRACPVFQGGTSQHGVNVALTTPTTVPPPPSTWGTPGTGPGAPPVIGIPPYDLTKDPGMGGEPPNIPGAAEAGGTFQGGAPWGPGQQPPTGPAEPGQPQPPTYTGTEPPPGAGPPGATGPQPPWYPPYQCGYPGYPPCPPGYSPPYDPTGKPPWEGLIPPSEPGMPPKPKPPMGGPGPGGCPPGCHIKPGTNQCHCAGN